MHILREGWQVSSEDVFAQLGKKWAAASQLTTSQFSLLLN